MVGNMSSKCGADDNREVKDKMAAITKTKATSKKGTRKSAKPTSKVVVLRPKARGQYRIVESDSQNIMPSSVDNRTEDEILSPSRRGRLLDICRNLVRNSSLMTTILGSLTTNVVSTCGGKVVLSLPSDNANKDLRRGFRAWTRNTDFHTGDCLNKFLKRALREYVIGGDVVVLFDDNLIEDSGKLLMFESEELVDVPPEEVEKRYGKGAWCSQGKVYSAHGRHIGTIVSKSARNVLGVADPDKCYFLKKDPNGNPMDNYWFQLSSNWREGRGVSQVSSACSTIHQLEDLVTSELLAARKNSQLFCWLEETPEDKVVVPTPFDVPADMSDDEMREYIAGEIEQNEKPNEDGDEHMKTISFNRAKEAGLLYEQLPGGFKANQLDTKHPNESVQTMVEFLSNRAAATLGLSRVYALGNPEDSNWKSNQLFTYPTILEFQKTVLEPMLDWIFAQWKKWATRKGIVTSYVIEDFMDFVDWSWRGIDELSPVEYQTGIRLALENNTKTYKEILGNDWMEKLEQTAFEHKWMAEHGITHPAEKLISGGESEASKRLQREGQQPQEEEVSE